MLFGRRKKKPNDRVLDLKARVDALRAADEATRQKPYSLDHFLEGDDVLTGRTQEDDYKPADSVEGAAAFVPGVASGPQEGEFEQHFEVDLQAELEKYIRRQEELSSVQDGESSSAPASKPVPPVHTWEDSASTQARPSPAAGAWDDGSTARPPVSKWPADEQWQAREDEAV